MLKDPEKRAAYDQMGSQWKTGQDFQPPPGWDAGFEFSGSQNVDITVGAPATATTFCIIGHNTNLGTADGYWTYSKAKGGLLPTVATSLGAAQTACAP